MYWKTRIEQPNTTSILCSLRFLLLRIQSRFSGLLFFFSLSPVHKAQLLSYMKLLNIPVGLLINFHELKLVDGITRMMLPGANLDL